jgi:hypothetical protein
MSYFDVIKTDTVNNYYLYTWPEIEKLQKNISGKNLEAFKQDMEDMFLWPLESVTSREAPSGTAGVPAPDIHDYMSLATYYWPDEQNPGGPYVRRDGFANPQGALYDKDKLKRLAYLSYHGALLYFLTGEDRYSGLVRKHLYNWFIDEKTRMNPHLEYGQFIPGVVKGRAEGLIDYGASFSYALNMIHLLNQRGLLDKALAEGLASWHGSFYSWLKESAIGLKERDAKNNHGTFYDFTLSLIEQFLGCPEQTVLRKDFFVKERIEKQIAPDFSLPAETARTRSLSYSFMGLKGLLETAKLFNAQGINLYPLLKPPVDWLYEKAVVRRAEWPFEQVTPFDEGSYLVFLELVSGIYGGEYRKIEDYVDRDKILNPVLAYLF